MTPARAVWHLPSQPRCAAGTACRRRRRPDGAGTACRRRSLGAAQSERPSELALAGPPAEVDRSPYWFASGLPCSSPTGIGKHSCDPYWMVVLVG